MAGSRPQWADYLFTVMFCALALPLTLILPSAHSNPVFLFFLIAIAASAWRGGGQNAVLALVLVLIEEVYFVFAPVGTLVASPTLITRFAALLALAVGTAIVFSRLRTSNHHNLELLAQERQTREAAEFAAARLQESEAKFRSLFAHSLDAIFLTMPDGTVTAANPAACTLFAMSEEELCQAGRQGLIDPTDSRHMTAVEERARTGKLNAELSYVRKDGTKFTAEVSSVILGGQPTRSFVVMRDITERKRAEEALRESETGLAAAQRIAHIGSWQWQVESDTSRWSDETFRIFGLLPGQVKTNHQVVSDLLHPADRDRVNKARIDALSGAGQYDVEFRICLPDGSEKVVRSQAEVLRNRDGTPVLMQGTAQDITARRRAEEALRRSEAGLAAAQRIAHIGSWQWDVQRDTALWSEETYRIFDLTLSELKDHRKGFLDRIHPADREQVDTALADALSGTREYDLEYRIGLPDGSEKVIYSQAEVLRNSDGTPIAMQGTVHDITERKRVEQALQESTRRYLAVARCMPDTIWSMDLSGRSTYVSPNVERTRGWTVEEILQLPLRDRVGPDQAARTEQVIKEELARAASPEYDRNKVINFESVQVRKGGTTFWAEVNASFIWSDDGRPIGLTGVTRDITERKRVEAALRENEDRLRVALDSAQFGTFDFNPLTGDLVWDAQMKQIWGIPPGEKLGFAQALERIHAEDRERVSQIIAVALAPNANGHYEAEYRIIWPDGTTRWSSARGRVYFQGEGEQRQAVRMVGVQRDITERKQAEEEKAQLQSQLLQAQKLESVGQLAGGVAHDFNNLLQIINGYGDLLLRKLKQDDPLREQVAEIRQAGEQGAALTKQLLTFSREQILEPKPVDLNDVINQNQAMLQRLVGEDIEVETSLSLALGQIISDPGRLHQLLMNLAANSRDAMPHGGKFTIRTANVDIRAAETATSLGLRPGRFVLLQVSDTGAGIPKEIQERVFDPFFTTKDRGKGTGLGLATVYGIVRLSGGAISVHSESGHGTTFNILLPRVRASVPDTAGENTSPDSLRGMETVLVVEDRLEVRKLAVNALQDSGYQVLEAAEGREALQVAENHSGPIDLLLTDVIMPHMTGKELAERLKPLRPEIKVLYMSGYAADVISSRGSLSSGESYIAKPFSLDALLTKMREFLKSSSDPLVAPASVKPESR